MVLKVEYLTINIRRLYNKYVILLTFLKKKAKKKSMY